TSDYEIIMVDDGSPDNSLSLALNILETDEHLRVVELSRNFGHHKAMMTGLEHASGDFVFLLDVDLEEDPAWLSHFWKLLHEQHVDVIYGYQIKHKGGALE